MKTATVRIAVEATSPRSAWNKGVKHYALHLLDNCEETELTLENCKGALLNGALDWQHYSWGGCAYVYDRDIAETLCTPSELKRTNYGEECPNKHELWPDVQARALKQAYGVIRNIIFDW